MTKNKRTKNSRPKIVLIIFYFILAALLLTVACLRIWHFYSSHAK